MNLNYLNGSKIKFINTFQQVLPVNPSRLFCFRGQFSPKIGQSLEQGFPRFRLQLQIKVVRKNHLWIQFFRKHPSACLQFQIRWLHENKIYSDDHHFHTQHEFIQSVVTDKIDYFYFNDTVIQSINDHYNLNFSIVPQHNKGTKLVTAVDESLIKKLYAKDYELINSVKFVNMP